MDVFMLPPMDMREELSGKIINFSNGLMSQPLLMLKIFLVVMVISIVGKCKRFIQIMNISLKMKMFHNLDTVMAYWNTKMEMNIMGSLLITREKAKVSFIISKGVSILVNSKMTNKMAMEKKRFKKTSLSPANRSLLETQTDGCHSPCLNKRTRTGVSNLSHQSNHCVLL